MSLKIDPKSWAELSRLLDAALDLPMNRRARYVDTLDSALDGLKPQLRELLAHAADVETADFLQTLPRIEVAQIANGGEAGQAVGPYRLMRELGRGGMGSVWLAERTDGILNRPVALKLPHLVRARSDLSERMAREREILAALNHPNIATLYDAGVSANGQPYLALEYVEGQPLDQYCLRKELDLTAKLKLFAQVAHAVAFAHAKLVVHRDLKPSNIFVTPDGRVRLLDFGIAKLLDEDNAQRSKLTELSGTALTPDYASPEQILGQPISIASDVYSLGVILYELVAECRPYKLRRESRGALEDAIVQVDPIRPSEAATRGKREIRGEVDLIVLKALKKNPDERYATANALVDDIYRFLDRRPIAAQPDRFSYRARKFLSRNKLMVVASVVALVALLAGTGVSLWQMVEARNQRDLAQGEAQKSERIAKLLQDILITAAPENAQGRELTIRQVLDQSIRRLRESNDDPVVRARMLHTIGYVYHRLGDRDKGRPLIEEAIAMARKAGAEGELEVGNALSILGQLQRHGDDVAGAERSYRESLEIQRRLLPADDERTNNTLNELALLLRSRAPEEALGLYRIIHSRVSARFGPRSVEAGSLLANIGAQQTRMRRYGEANETLLQARDILRSTQKGDDPRYATVLNNLAITEKELGNYERALVLQREDNEIATRALGPDHYEIGASWLNMARTNQKLGDWSEALKESERALSILGKHFQPNHALLLAAHETHAQILARIGKENEAIAELEQATIEKPSSVEGRFAARRVRTTLAFLQLQSNQIASSLKSAEWVISDSDPPEPSILAQARLARACAMALRGEAGAVVAFDESMGAFKSDSRTTPLTMLLARARFAACSAQAETASKLLSEAQAAGFRDQLVLGDPIFRNLPPANR